MEALLITLAVLAFIGVASVIGARSSNQLAAALISGTLVAAGVAAVACHREQPTRTTGVPGAPDTPQCQGYRFPAIASGQLATLVVRTAGDRPRVVELHFDAAAGWRLTPRSRGRLGVRDGVASPSPEGACFTLQGSTDPCIISAKGKICALWETTQAK